MAKFTDARTEEVATDDGDKAFYTKVETYETAAELEADISQITKEIAATTARFVTPLAKRKTDMEEKLAQLA